MLNSEDPRSNVSAFVPFESVLRSTTSGFHDGTRIGINARNLADAVVADHEGVHQEIYLGSPDGCVLSSFLQILSLQKDRANFRAPEGLSSLTQSIFRNSTFAHEAAATYISIKRNLPGAGEQTHQRLPQAYKEYYAALADLIDPLTSDNLVQCLIAGSIWRVVFDSFYQMRLIDSGLENAPSPSPEECPDTRFQILLSTLHETDLREMVENLGVGARAYRERLIREGISLADRATEATAARVWMNNFYGAVRSHLKAIVPLPCLSTELSPAVVLAKWRTLVAPYGLSIMVEDENSDSEGAVAYWQGRSVLTNRSVLPAEDGCDGDLNDDLLSSLTEYQVLSAEPPKSFERWLFVGFSPWAEQPWGGNYSSVAVLKWLARCRDLEQKFQQYPRSRALTVAARTVSEIERFQPFIIENLGIRGPSGEILGRSDAVIWYWRNSWLQLLWQLSEMGPLESMTIRLVKPPSVDTEVSAAVHIKLIKSPSIAGPIMRVLTERAAHEVWIKEKRLYEEGKIVHMEAGARRDNFSRAAQNSFQLIKDYWRIF